MVMRKAANVTEAEISYYEMKEKDGFCLTEAFFTGIAGGCGFSISGKPE